jgi:uncharacterized protein YhbP (UPF0306 family)
MAIKRSKRPVASSRIATTARSLLEASTLCAIATVTPGGEAHVNTAYFAWSDALQLVWLSEPTARHSRNVRRNGSAAVAVYDAEQRWGSRDRGIQLFGVAQELERFADGDASQRYAARFPGYRPGELSAYRFYAFNPRRLKLFDESELGAGVFVTARLRQDRRLVYGNGRRSTALKPDAARDECGIDLGQRSRCHRGRQAWRATADLRRSLGRGIAGARGLPARSPCAPTRPPGSGRRLAPCGAAGGSLRRRMRSGPLPRLERLR